MTFQFALAVEAGTRAINPQLSTLGWTLSMTRLSISTPAEVYATRLHEGRYVCSERTTSRVLVEHQEVRERRNSCGIRTAPAPNCSPGGPTTCGVGPSPSCSGPGGVVARDSRGVTRRAC